MSELPLEKLKLERALIAQFNASGRPICSEALTALINSFDSHSLDIFDPRIQEILNQLTENTRALHAACLQPEALGPAMSKPLHSYAGN
jgi:hypothetical protein